MRDAGRQKYSATGLRSLQKHIHAADQLPVRGYVDREEIVPIFRFNMAQRGQWPQNPGIADQYIEALISLIERQREARNAFAILDVERYQRGGAAGRPDPVIEVFKPANRAAHRNHVCAGMRQLKRDSGADAARGAGDKRDTVGKGLGIICHSAVKPGRRRVPTSFQCRL